MKEVVCEKLEKGFSCCKAPGLWLGLGPQLTRWRTIESSADTSRLGTGADEPKHKGAGRPVLQKFRCGAFYRQRDEYLEARSGCGYGTI
ncbi:hypothetical protein CHM34_14885 [Paludifilum halophilum]|uniref:Uncharacterized protein n=1 Tax=Paludifilum halophilum TaxID=1642702 RepID=A0A235B3M2_9BACL|nr:hypothetical protein CHM34_14885 [Paludifilum halophilum]